MSNCNHSTQANRLGQRKSRDVAHRDWEALAEVGVICLLATAMFDLQALMGRWRYLQAVSHDSDAGEHGEGNDLRGSTKDCGQEFHGAALIEIAPAEAGT